MKLLKASEIKKIVFGLVASDGYIQISKQRFEVYSKYEEYAQHIYDVLSQITGMDVRFKVKHDKRGYTGYRVWTNKHPYWKNIGKKFYNGRKFLSEYTVNRFDARSLAYIWMSDGYLEHNKNRKLNKVQNKGFIFFEAFPKEEMEIMYGS